MFFFALVCVKSKRSANLLAMRSTVIVNVYHMWEGGAKKERKTVKMKIKSKSLDKPTVLSWYL